MDFHLFVVSDSYQKEVALVIAAPKFAFVFCQAITGQLFRSIFAASTRQKVMLCAITGILKVVLMTTK